jgi:hypothetical protein
MSHLVLPAGTFDLANDIPHEDVNLIATEAMLVARDDLSTAIVHLLVDAAREVHSTQGFFEKPREFPNTEPVDIPVSSDADRHQRFGPSFIHRTLPFFFATFVERLVILLVPLLVVIVPLVNLLPQLLRWRARSRIYRWYGELALLERDIASRTGAFPSTRGSPSSTASRLGRHASRRPRATPRRRTPCASISRSSAATSSTRSKRDST